MAEIGPNTRLRVSPFYDSTVAEGVVAFTPYNKMLMPTSYGQPDVEYDRLLNGVAMWDVAVERQVEITGPDAATLAQMLSTRDLSKAAIYQGKYVAMCDHDGTLLNDPIVVKLDENKFWLSIADNNMLLWTRAIARERGLNAQVREPDVSPLAVQGPKAADVVASIFGDNIRDLRFFWFMDAEIEGIPLKISRSGYSKQGGFELYLMDESRGNDLWAILREAGAPYGIGPGNPNPAERIESGLLSFGGDTDDETNPFEVRLNQYVDLDLDEDVIGVQALRKIKTDEPKRQQLGIKLDNQKPQRGHAIWYDVFADGRKIGSMTNGIWSPRIAAFIGYVLVDQSVKPGDPVDVLRHGRLDRGTLSTLPFC